MSERGKKEYFKLDPGNSHTLYFGLTQKDSVKDSTLAYEKLHGIQLILK
jgi:hypothetical protein